MNDFVNRQDLLDGIEELKQSPWFKNGEDKQDIQHYGHLERKEAVEVVTDLCIKKEPSAWIPGKYRDMTQEEIERYSEYTEATKMFDCKMPDDGQDILVSTRGGYVYADICEIDDMYGIGLEDYGDWEDIVAWIPLPEPYKEAAGHDKSQ